LVATVFKVSKSFIAINWVRKDNALSPQIEHISKNIISYVKHMISSAIFNVNLLVTTLTFFFQFIPLLVPPQKKFSLQKSTHPQDRPEHYNTISINGDYQYLNIR